MAKKNDLTEDTEYNDFDDDFDSYESGYYTDEETAASESGSLLDEDNSQGKVGGIRALSVIFCLLAIGGLFIGLLSKWVSFLAPLAIAGEGKLGNSMLGLIIEGFKDLFGKESIAEYGFEGLFSPMVASFIKVVPYLTLVLAVGVVVSLVLTIATLITKNAGKAKKILYVNGYIVFLVYAAFFIGMFAARLLSHVELPYKYAIDFPTAIIAGVALLILFGMAIKDKKAIAAFNFLLLVLVLVAGFGLLYRDSLTIDALRISFVRGNTGAALWIQIFALATAIMLVINFIVSALRLNSDKKYLFVTVCYGLQFALAVALALVLVFKAGDATDWSLLGQLSVLVLLIASLAVFAAALLFVILRAVKARKALAEEQPQTEEEETVTEYGDDDMKDKKQAKKDKKKEKKKDKKKGDETPVINGENAAYAGANPNGQYDDNAYDDDYIDYDDYEEDDEYEYEYEPDYMPPAAAMQYMAPPPPPPAPAPQPAPEPQPQPAPQPTIIQPPAPNIVILREKEKPAPAPAPQPAPPPPPAPAPAPAPEPQPAPLSEFEQRMADYARQGVPKPAPAPQPAPEPQPRVTVTERRPVAPAPQKKQPAPQQQQPAPNENVYEDGQYTYDAFFHTLTPKQKSEFGDLFISNKYGTHNYLPVYVIGGDNKAFFSKVFIYLGRFRETISAGLLEKMYQYVNTKK